MRIAMIVAGAGSMYCGACARDADLARALIEAGQQVAVFPIYTPIRLEEDLGIEIEPLRMGGINAFLREKYPRLARAKMLNSLLDRPSLITWASQFAVRTQASDLGQMTVSFLEGVDGPHGGEIERIAQDVALFQPRIVILANTLLAGMIDPLTRATGAPVVCQVQGEDGFLLELPEPWRGKSLLLLREQVEDASHFIAPCKVHAHEMSELLKQPIFQFSVVPPSVKNSPNLEAKSSSKEVRIGHLSSIRRAKGLDMLIEALSNLKDLSWDLSIRGKILEPMYYKELVRMAESKGIAFEYGGEVTPDAKAGYLRGCDFIVLPTRLSESRGIVALEALASGTPVIAPSRGIFPELARVTGGVALYDAPEALADTIRSCIAQRVGWHQRGAKAAHAVSETYFPARSAAAAEACFQRILSAG
ncbi:MAG: glycosyltransferase family 4 protein [Fimbriimonas sp.]|nr:glycosyltransferase family 4 protein [Fimbriimonas sp.]